MIFLWALRLLLSAQLVLHVQCVVNGIEVDVELLQDRSQVWVDAPYGRYADDTDVRGCGGVLIHSSFVLTSGNTLGRKLDVNGFRVRVASTWSFQYGHVRMIDKYYQLRLEPERDWERFRVILAHLATPFISETTFSHLAYVAPLHYHHTMFVQVGGFGAQSKNWLYHKLHRVNGHAVYISWCMASYQDISYHEKVPDAHQVIKCYTDRRCPPRTGCPTEEMGRGRYYDDGNGLFVWGSNILIGSLTTRQREKVEFPLMLTIAVPQFQIDIVRHIRRFNMNLYRDASEQEFEYLEKDK